jgi:predicted nucleotidyltransferase component of viral defense system
MALKSHLRRQAQALGVSPQRLQKDIVFERLMARLLVVAPNRWVLKGGVALDFRYLPEARATKDLDLAWLSSEEEATRDLMAAQSVDLGDYFTFAIRRQELTEWTAARSASYQVDVEIAAHHYTSVAVDVGFGDPVGATVEIVRPPDLLGFAGIDPLALPTLPLRYHVAEKVHAYTRRYVSGPSSRPKDLIDLVIISSHESIDAGSLREAVQQTFAIRNTHPLPSSLPEPPEDWAVSYSRLAGEVRVPASLREGYSCAQRFLNPILADTLPDSASWDPHTKGWVA